ncbi:LysR family transcriptional regulator [Burkholderia anthina]|uniref:LysR family transcriptional regulator n=1 Tax=Burkholderia anthina TaxID=179879 RepID=UPI00075F6A01|nr:LysR family transcriptional regulator [Burkholderia anthina]KVN53116.1 hypothetical protein WT13_32025 [Burkholderia anthina]
MDKLHAMQTFVRIVETGGFSKAAETMQLPRSSVTTIIKNLEQHLGVQLLQRSTRRVSVTSAGAAYYTQCVTILSDIATAEAAISLAAITPRGRVRVDLPGAIARALIVPNLPRFAKQFPEIDLVLKLNDKPIDLVEDGVDCVIRSGVLSDSNFVAKRIGMLHWITCASPSYLERFGSPREIDDLHKHFAVNYLSPSSGRPIEFTFDINHKHVTVHMPGQFSVNETGTYLDCALEGLGLIQVSEIIAAPYLRTGRLREVLSHIRRQPVPISVVFPAGKHRPAAVRTFVEWITALFDKYELAV